MLRIGESFYSFNQSAFVEDAAMGCVQIIDAEAFSRTYADQVWRVADIPMSPERESRMVEYFSRVATAHGYSLRNNCTLECQRALEAAGFGFPRDFILPGRLLASVSRRRAALGVESVSRITVREGLPSLGR